IYERGVENLTRRLSEFYDLSTQEIPPGRELTPEELLEGMRRYGERLAHRSQFLILRLHDHGCFVGKPMSKCRALFRWVMKEGNSKKKNVSLVRSLKSLPDFVDSIAETASILERLADDLHDWSMDLQIWTKTVERLADSYHQKVRSGQESRRP
ncbi:MAG: hypothetical protein ACYCZ0_04865, partial [Minisyncoccota bacterium]